MWWKAVVFDLDDSLYPERQYVTSGMRAVSAWLEQRLRFPKERTFRELCALAETAERGQTFNHWAEFYELDPRIWVLRMVQVYRCHSPQIRPYPEVNAVLQRLAARCRLGLVSDGYREAQRRKWDALKLDQYFHAVVFSDDLGRDNWKPSPLPFRTALAKLAAPAERAVYVGDNPSKDFSGARRIGMQTIRLRRQDGLYCHLDLPGPDGSADAEVADLTQVEFQLAQLAKNRCTTPASSPTQPSFERNDT